MCDGGLACASPEDREKMGEKASAIQNQKKVLKYFGIYWDYCQSINTWCSAKHHEVETKQGVSLIEIAVSWVERKIGGIGIG